MYGRHKQYATSQADGKFGKLARTFSRNRKITVRLQGTACYTDNEKLINLPANADFLTPETQHLLEGCLDHETGHCERQQQGIEERIRGNVNFPLYTEEVKKLKSAKERNLLNVFEDIALEINASRKYVGMSDNLRELNEVLTKRLAANVSKLSAWKALTCGLISSARGFDASWVPAKVQPLLDALEPVIARAKVETDHVGQSVKRVHETMAIIKKFAEAEPEEADEHEGEATKDDVGSKGKPNPKGTSKPEKDEDKDGSAGDEGEETEHGAGEQDEDQDGGEEGGEEGSSGDGEEDESAGGESGEDEAPGEAGEESDEDSSSPGKGESDKEAKPSKDKSKSKDEAKKGIPSDTIDFAKELDKKDSDIEHVTDEINKDIEKESARDMATTKRHYPLPDACALDRIKTVEHDADDERIYRILLDEVRPIVAGLRSRLMLYLRAQKDEAIQGDKERGHIDDQALYGLRTGDKRVFYTRTETEDINTVIGILVDESGSMNEVGPSESRIQVAAKSVIAVAECLAKLQIPFAAWGFHNMRMLHRHITPDEMEMYNRFKSLDIDVYKTFDEPFARTRGRFTKIRAGGDNTDGEAVQYCIDQLRRRPEARKILLVLSDGNPLSGYSDDKALRLHLKEVVKGATKLGVEVFGIGIQDDAVKHFYPDFTVIKNTLELPKAMFQMLRKYLMRPARSHAV